MSRYNILEAFKLWWMLFWRIALIAIFTPMAGSGTSHFAILVITGVVAFLAVYGFHISVRTFPIFRTLFKAAKGALIELPREIPSNSSVQQPQIKVSFPTPPAAPPAPTLKTASSNGRMTGYEPHCLESLPIPSSKDYPLMSGRPASGISQATGMSKVNISLGAKGEINFAKILAKTGLLERFTTVWSVSVPDQTAFIPMNETDIDCIMSTGNALLLIDLKFYKSGNVRYFSQGDDLYCEDVATGQIIGEPKRMSRNMEIARNNVSIYFPGLNIVPMVVFIPTDKGEGTIDNVTWPGDIPAITLTQFIQLAKNSAGLSAPNSVAYIKAADKFKTLVKK